MRTKKPRLQLHVLVVAALLAGTGAGCSDDEPASPSGTCSPGETAECPCPGGGEGTQTCGDDGTSFGACLGCEGEGPAGAGGSGSSTTGSGASSGAGASGGQGGEPNGPFSLTDTLKDNAPKGNLVGGSLGPNGWTVTSKTDRVWYSIPRLVEGSIEFTVTGITTANLDLADHEIFAMYDGGHGIAEPINYNPEYRDNHYKQLLRIYGQMVPDRLGAQKFIMLMCPDGAPGYGTCQCPKNYYDGDHTWGGDTNWTGAPSQIKITWGQGKATYSRDGVDVWTNDYTATGLVFGPEEQHFTLGCPRHDAIGDAGMPIGATFSDVIVQGIEGDVATCN